MTDIVATTDPISLKDLHGDTEDKPYAVEDLGGGHVLTVFFENEENLKEYSKIPVEDAHEGYDIDLGRPARCDRMWSYC
ncbi:MAG: hypothetical protein HQL52_09310 [Magnetococcales bacterium]|nr:hypothetical protein [Magnetococcales bacterium]